MTDQTNARTHSAGNVDCVPSDSYIARWVSGCLEMQECRPPAIFVPYVEHGSLGTGVFFAYFMKQQRYAWAEGIVLSCAQCIGGVLWNVAAVVREECPSVMHGVIQRTT